ncbi:recombinase family protein [Kitasatospora sp. NPDC048239]|uniref:recombinase family protein n=1 Tax=Kitasatospora sp. NPDC048239 TaxID=3364046 RepID=UPI00371E0476
MNARTLPRQRAALRAALYGRASVDPKRRGRSIKDQFAEAETECQEHGWRIVGYYEDRDRSASRRAKKAREHFEQLLSDIEAGLIDVVVYAERSRTARNLDTALKLRQLCEDTGVLLCYDGRVFDMRHAPDRKEFTRDALQAEEEAEATIARAERTTRLAARRGAPHGKVPFGFQRRYDPDDGHLLGQFPHPKHAPVVRELFAKAAAGESILALLALYRRYVPTAQPPSVRVLLQNRSYVGVRMHRGQEMDECQWEGIVDEGVFAAVQEILGAPERRIERDGKARHLLSGIAECPRCRAEGRALPYSAVRAAMLSGKVRYRCSDGRCHAMVIAEQAEALVEASVFEWLGSSAAAAAFRPLQDEAALGRARGRAAAMQQQLKDARRMAGTFDENGVPELTIQSLAEAEQRLLPLIAAEEAEMARMTATSDPLLTLLVGQPVDRIAQVWNKELLLPQRRHLLRLVVNIDIRPGGKGRQLPLTERVVLTFAGEPGFVSRRTRERGLEVVTSGS